MKALLIFCIFLVGFAVVADSFSTGASTNTVPGTLTITGTNLTPVLAIGTNDTSHQTAILVERTIAQATNGAHAYEDFTTLSTDGPYATFDARVQVTNSVNHLNGFQFRPQLYSGANVTNILGVEIAPTIGSGATNATYKGIYIEDGTGSGDIGIQYGLYIDSLAKGATNFSIVTGTASSQFTGNVGIGMPPTTNALDVAGPVRLNNGFTASAGTNSIYEYTDLTNTLLTIRRTTSYTNFYPLLDFVNSSGNTVASIKDSGAISSVSESSGSGYFTNNVQTPRIIATLLEHTKDLESTINIYNDGSYRYRDAGYGFLQNLVSGSYYWRNAASASAGAVATLSAKMVLDTSGQLGIGSFPPTAKLDVNGAVKATGYQIGTVPGFTGFTTNGLAGFVTNKLYWSGGILTNVETISF